MSFKESEKYRSWVEIDLDAFRHNLDEIGRLVGPGTSVMQVVKADAYGHGAIEISREALKRGASCLGVANADEGVQLRAGGIEAPVIILGPSPVSEIDEILKYDLRPSVSDLHFARELDRRMGSEKGKVSVHIEIDTGMGRGGTMQSEAVAMIREVLSLSRIHVEGVFSHFAMSEAADEEYNARQFALFQGLLEELEREGMHIPVRHISNGGAVLNFPEYGLDMVRPGLVTYGVYPGLGMESRADLRPVMAFKTRVVLLKRFPEGYSIGYGRSYVTDRPSTIATIPVGYGDGYGAVLSNRGEVLIRGRRAPLVGRVSMDMCTVDVTDIADCDIGDEAVLLGRQGEGYIPANEIAEKTGTISYEVLCVLGKRAPRIFLDRGRAGAVAPRLRRVFIPDEERSIARIDSILRSCLQTRACDADLGDAIYYEMFETLFGKENRRLELRSGFRYDINVRNFTGAECDADEKVKDYLNVTTHVEYIKTLKSKEFMIGCARDNRQLSLLFEDERCEYRWLLPERGRPLTEGDFSLERVRVDGLDVPVRDVKETARGYEVWCGGDGLDEKVDEEVRVEIDIATKKHRESNIFSVYLVYPTRGFDISFSYGDAGIRNVREVSYFAGRHPEPEVKVEEGRSITLSLSDDEWVFPTSGVTFIWDIK